ncbi:MAG: peptidylprolyl isomerase [Litorilinea sp.]
MARRNKRVQPEQRQLTPKEVRLNARRRERDRRHWTIIGSVLAVAVLIVVAGILNEFVIKPTSTIATVGDTEIATREFWDEARLEHNRLQNQLIQMRQFEQQFGSQSFLMAQINELQATLSSPFALGLHTLDRMVDRIIIRQEAEARDITITDEEVEALLREEIAANQGAVTEPQATSTAEAAVEATATAASWTPTPVPTADASSTLTDTETLTDTVAEVPTPEPPPPAPLLTEEQYQEGLTELVDNLGSGSDLDLDDYRALLRDRLLAERLEEIIGNENLVTTEEQINARHILLNIIEPQPEPAVEPTAVPEGAPTPIPTPEPRNEDETLALAQELRQRLLDGEDFAELALEYSDDTGSAVNGGDLGWFGPGRMVPVFEEAAFALEEGEISEPIRSDFGYHIIQVVERDDARPKTEDVLMQERQMAFDTWLDEKVAEANVERPSDISARMPRDLRNIAPVNLVPPPVPQ